MKKRIMIFVHTEYHLLIAVNQILVLYNDINKYNIELYIRVRSGGRLTLPLDFSDLPVSVCYFIEEISIDNKLKDKAREAIEGFKRNIPDIFIFFQEEDTLMVILSGYYSKLGTEVFLYQDGLKPYGNLKFHSLGLLVHHHKQNIWLRKHGFPVESWLSPIFSKKYAFLKGISKVFLTFPESYENWNNKPIEKIEFLETELLKPALKKLFRWDDALLPVRENLIFFMNQPMHDDGKAETELLRSLGQKFPSNPIYIKLHPLIEDKKLEQYKTFENVKIIKSSIPAELFIMNLNSSIILSVNSTSMFLNNPDNKFYYLFKIFKNEIKRLNRYQYKGMFADHIIRVDSIEDIGF